MTLPFFVCVFQMQQEVYHEYLDLMYGPEPATNNSENGESEEEIIRPQSKLLKHNLCL